MKTIIIIKKFKQINFNQYENNYYNPSKLEIKGNHQISNEDDNLQYSYFIDKKEYLKRFHQKIQNYVVIKLLN